MVVAAILVRAKAKAKGSCTKAKAKEGSCTQIPRCARQISVVVVVLLTLRVAVLISVVAVVLLISRVVKLRRNLMLTVRGSPKGMWSESGMVFNRVRIKVASIAKVLDQYYQQVRNKVQDQYFDKMLLFTPSIQSLTAAAAAAAVAVHRAHAQGNYLGLSF